MITTKFRWLRDLHFMWSIISVTSHRIWNVVGVIYLSHFRERGVSGGRYIYIYIYFSPCICLSCSFSCLASTPAKPSRSTRCKEQQERGWNGGCRCGTIFPPAAAAAACLLSSLSTVYLNRSGSGCSPIVSEFRGNGHHQYVDARISPARSTPLTDSRFYTFSNFMFKIENSSLG